MNKIEIKKLDIDLLQYSSIEDFELFLEFSSIDIASLEGVDLEQYNYGIRNIRNFMLKASNHKDWPYLKDRLSRWFPEYKEEQDSDNREIVNVNLFNKTYGEIKKEGKND